MDKSVLFPKSTETATSMPPVANELNPEELNASIDHGFATITIGRSASTSRPHRFNGPDIPARFETGR
jgi:hypothetical protein